MPSSFTMIHSTPRYTLPIYLCRFRVRAATQLAHEDFLGSIGSPTPHQKDAVPSCLTQKWDGFTYPTCHTLSPGQPPPGMGYLPASLRSLSNTSSGHRLTEPSTPESANETAHMLSITSLNTVAVQPVPEYQLVIHRLRLSASP